MAYSNRIFLNFDFAGEATEDDYAEQVNCLRCTMNIVVSQQENTGNLNAVGSSQHSGITLTKHTCTATPSIVEKASSGIALSNDAIITFCRFSNGTLTEYRKITLTGVKIVKYEMLDARGFEGEDDKLPTESFTLVYQTIEDSYTPLAADGSTGGQTAGGYDVSQSKGQ
ncbi:type VI secretion system tube protein Hcp [Rhodospirillaceae bacterium]|nr:type VI secretion system tube protein Hcp [Rhodospirillaceae bacterium]